MFTMATDECLYFLTTMIVAITITLTNTSRRKAPLSVKAAIPKMSEPPESPSIVGCFIVGST